MEMTGLIGWGGGLFGYIPQKRILFIFKIYGMSGEFHNRATSTQDNVPLYIRLCKTFCVRSPLIHGYEGPQREGCTKCIFHLLIKK